MNFDHELDKKHSGDKRSPHYNDGYEPQIMPDIKLSDFPRSSKPTEILKPRVMISTLKAQQDFYRHLFGGVQMPATRFICPDGKEWPISDCLNHCRMPQRCMMLPTLRAIQAQQRNLEGFSVTELISGTREAYLKRTKDYAIDPQERLFALHGTAVHAVAENHTEGFFAENRLYGEFYSGSPDIYGDVLGDGRKIIGDYKVTSSYKIMKALGIYKEDVLTGEVYKTGARKGEPKTRKEIRTGGVRHVLEWAMQLNAYRLLIKKPVEAMLIQALCRDYSLQIAVSRGVDQKSYIIPIHRISDHWINLYFRTKAKRLRNALETKKIPPVCRSRERWHGRKCKDYCEVADHCDCLDTGRSLENEDFFAKRKNEAENGFE